MSAVKPNFNPENLYFVTTTTASKMLLFDRDVIKRIIVDSLNYLRVSKWINLYGFVVMPNHVHFLARFISGRTLAESMREFKKHTARQIIRQFLSEGNQIMLNLIEKAAQHSKKQKYKVWEKGYDARDIFTPEFLIQKMEYVHNNPCQPQWQLVENPEDYTWSSARFYSLDEPAIITVDDVREFLV